MGLQWGDSAKVKRILESTSFSSFGHNARLPRSSDKESRGYTIRCKLNEVKPICMEDVRKRKSVQSEMAKARSVIGKWV